MGHKITRAQGTSVQGPKGQEYMSTSKKIKYFSKLILVSTFARVFLYSCVLVNLCSCALVIL